VILRRWLGKVVALTLESTINIACPHCHALIARKNGFNGSGKQKFQCLSRLKQFVEDPQNKIIPQDTKERISELIDIKSGFMRPYALRLPLFISTP
jgi:transposase-like protein